MPSRIGSLTTMSPDRPVGRPLAILFERRIVRFERRFELGAFEDHRDNFSLHINTLVIVVFCSGAVTPNPTYTTGASTEVSWRGIAPAMKSWRKAAFRFPLRTRDSWCSFVGAKPSAAAILEVRAGIARGGESMDSNSVPYI